MIAWVSFFFSPFQSKQIKARKHFESSGVQGIYMLYIYSEWFSPLVSKLWFKIEKNFRVSLFLQSFISCGCLHISYDYLKCTGKADAFEYTSILCILYYELKTNYILQIRKLAKPKKNFKIFIFFLKMYLLTKVRAQLHKI